MQGAWSLLAALTLAQAISLPFGRRLWLVRLVAGLVLGLWVLTPLQGFTAALFYTTAPLVLWLPVEIAGRRLTRPSWKLSAASELVYALLAVSWVTLQAPLRGSAILAWIETARSPVALGLASVYFAAIFGGERVVRGAIAPFLGHLPPNDQSALPRAGRVIGWSERFVVMTLIAAGYGEPVGWLLAAKTAMRYPEIKQESTGRLGEYFFVGTLLSISIGVVAGLAVRWLLAQPLH